MFLNVCYSPTAICDHYEIHDIAVTVEPDEEGTEVTWLPIPRPHENPDDLEYTVYHYKNSGDMFYVDTSPEEVSFAFVYTDGTVHMCPFTVTVTERRPGGKSKSWCKERV